MIQQNLTIASGAAISSVDEVPDKRQLVGIFFPTGFNGTATFIIQQTFDGGTSWIETYNSSNALYNPGWTANKVIPLPQEIGSSIQRYRIVVPINQSAARTLIALVK